MFKPFYFSSTPNVYTGVSVVIYFYCEQISSYIKNTIYYIYKMVRCWYILS